MGIVNLELILWDTIYDVLIWSLFVISGHKFYLRIFRRRILINIKTLKPAGDIQRHKHELYYTVQSFWYFHEYSSVLTS